MEERKIYDSHKPALEAGRYQISISQTLLVGSNELAPNPITIDFEVAGEKYTINQLQIDSIFPPQGAMGDFSLVLPHIILNRSTLPWEREAKTGDSDTPWLALLLFHEGEMSASEEKEDSKNYFVKHVPVSAWESGSFETTSTKIEKEDQVSILVCTDPAGWGSDLIPSFSELPYFAHVRSTGNDEKAVVVCKRLPQIDRKNIVHLVSLENCFDSGSFKGHPYVDNNTALVSLYSWEFFCNDHFILSKELIESSSFASELKDALLNIQDSEYFKDEDLIDAIKSKVINNSIKVDEDPLKKTLITTFRIGHLPDILKHLNRTPCTLWLPDKEGVPTFDISLGYVSLKYQLKTGKEIDAYYRGPMIPKADQVNPDSVCLFHADKALRYIKASNKLDVSYASAWELGKLLAIQNKNFSIALYKWKRECYQAIKQNNKELPDKLPEAPSYVSDWFENVKNLKGIPFNYLVPDPDFIPFESIRFFEIDETWLSYFIDGAFSVGRISNADKVHDEELYSRFNFLKIENKVRGGFLLHSVAVAGWPDLVIFNNDKDNFPFRKDKLSMNLLMCFFNEPIGTIGIHQKPESIHFGFEDQEAAKDGIAIKIKEFSEVAKFANDLIQKVELIQFTLG